MATADATGWNIVLGKARPWWLARLLGATKPDEPTGWPFIFHALVLFMLFA